MCLLRRKQLIAFSLSLSLCLFAAGCQSLSAPAAGAVAPDFALTDLDGKSYRLSDFKGKIVLLNFWASWCGSCIPELPHLNALYRKQTPSGGITIISVGSDDTLKSLKAMRQKADIVFPVLVDSDGAVKRIYGVRAFPETFLIGRDGKIRDIQDVEADELEQKIMGPRNWSSPDWQAYFEKLAQS